MDREEKVSALIEELKGLKDELDTEGAHMEADNILLKIIEVYGHPEVTEIFNSIDKWYA